MSPFHVCKTVAWRALPKEKDRFHGAAPYGKLFIAFKFKVAYSSD